MSEGNEFSKRHSACDQCRERKLRCSRLPKGCTRCIRQNLRCHYSVQKQMGRPRKRREVSDGLEDGYQVNRARPTVTTSKENSPNTDHEPDTIAAETIVDDSCPEVVDHFPSSNSLSLPPATLSGGPLSEPPALIGNGTDDVDSVESPPFDQPMASSLPVSAETFSPTFDWTEFSGPPDLPTMSISLPSQETSASDSSPFTTFPPSRTHHYHHVRTLPPPSDNPRSDAPFCPCLPNLYLSLSDLSTLPSRPISHHTVETLQAATRTAHAVLYCRTCPQNFQPSVQNVMLLGTLLTVIADGWSCILRAPAKDLARGFSVDPAASLSSDSDLDASWSDVKEKEWKLLAHYLFRHYVFGDAPPPGVHMPGICPMLSSTSASPNKPPVLILNNLCNAMERRQKSWHGTIENTGEFPISCSSADGSGCRREGHCSEEQRQARRIEMESMGKNSLCLKIVESVRRVLAGVSSTPGAS